MAIYKTTFRYVRENIWALVLIAMFLEVADCATEYLESSSAVTLIPLLLIALYLHLMVLTDTKLFDKRRAGSKLPIGSFVWASLMLIFTAAGAGALTAFYSGFAGDHAVGVFVIGFLGVYFLLLTLLGTSLPAAAAGDAYNPLISLKRSRHTWLGIAGGLLIGPVFLSTIYLAIIFGLSAYAGIDVNDYANISGATVPAAGYGALLHLLGLVSTTSAVVVLCRAYQKVIPVEVAARLKGSVVDTAQILA